MDNSLIALLLGLVEGLTEFLPISSTGHLILAGALLGYQNEKSKVFEIVIQTGAMFAIVWEYRARFLSVATGVFKHRESQQFLINVIVAFMPAAVLGLLFGSVIKKYLFSALPVAFAFIIGGVVILWVERSAHVRERERVRTVEAMTWRDALKVGLAQALALIPGTSRSGATIIGGRLLGLSRQVATEFSFFLAVPTLMAAGAYTLYKNRALLSASDMEFFSIGFIAAFISAFLCVRWLLHYITRHDFSVFAWYRIVFGLVVIVTHYAGVVHWAD